MNEQIRSNESLLRLAAKLREERMLIKSTVLLSDWSRRRNFNEHENQSQKLMFKYSFRCFPGWYRKKGQTRYLFCSEDMRSGQRAMSTKRSNRRYLWHRELKILKSVRAHFVGVKTNSNIYFLAPVRKNPSFFSCAC